MNTALSLASGALGAAVAALAWLITHSQQILKVVTALPALEKDVTAAKSAVDEHLVAVKAGAETAAVDLEKLAKDVAAKLGLATTVTPPADSAAQVPTVTQPAAVGAAMTPGQQYTVTADATGRLALPDGTLLSPSAA
jgi:predicted RNA-binding Zn ribbon-like protein